MDKKRPSSFVLQKVAERMLLRGREVEFPSVNIPSPLILVITLTEPPCPHAFCPCGLIVDLVLVNRFFSPSAVQSDPKEEWPGLVEHFLP